MSTPLAARAVRRVVRRETHPSRSVSAVAVAVVAIVVAAWVGTEAVLALAGLPALLLAPDALLGALAGIPDAAAPALVAGAVVVGLVVLWLVGLAVVPGRRDRRADAARRTTALVDDRVLASELARRVAHTARVSADQVVVTIGRYDVVARITPSSGREVPMDTVRADLSDAVTAFEVTPALRARVELDSAGRVGA